MKCEICENEYNNINGLSNHIKRTHKLELKSYYNLYLKKENEGICLNCGKETTFLSLGQGFSKYCSRLCSNTNSLHNENIKKSFFKKYGVKNPQQCKEIKEKTKKTNLERYGVENPFQSEKIKEKIKENNIKKYNKEYYCQTNEYNEKFKQTCLNLYGVEYPAQNNEIQNKMKETSLKKYGVENYFQSYEYKEKKKNETIEKYKNEFPFLRIIDYDISNYIMLCYCNECNKNYSIDLMLLGSRLRYLKYKNPCTNCFPVNTAYSNQEKELVDYIKTIYKGEIIENDRTILKGQELDIYLPEKKIAFEFDGLYWHSSEFKTESYHLNKTIECEKQGIQLVHIFENEWNNNKQIKKYIKNIINNDINIEDYNLIFKKENEKIIVDHRWNNGKILEKLNYKLQEILKPTPEKINVNNKIYEIYNCGYLIYKKE